MDPSTPYSPEPLHDRFRRLEARRLRPGWRGVVWSVCGWLGSRLLRREPPDIRGRDGARRLHLGCGDRFLDGWVNADFYRPQQLLPGRKGPDWMLDLTRRFPCPAEHWDGVFLEHVNEHLTYTQNLAAFGEVFRTLQPGGILRVVVPSLHRYLAWSELRGSEPKMTRYGSLAEAISNLTQNHAHQSVWDPALLREVLEGLGFVDVVERDYREGASPEMLHDGESHRWESLYFEARKPRATREAA